MAATRPVFSKTYLFEARKGGYATYRIPGIVVTAQGTVLEYCEARKSGRGDWGAIDILLRRSVDGGHSWSAPQKINRATRIPKNPVALQHKLARADERTYNNPVAIVDQTDAIHFLYCVEYARCYYLCSEDEGRSFSEPMELTPTFESFRSAYDWKVIATGPGHGLQLSSGCLLVPVWMSTGSGDHAHRPSVVSVIYSDDHGRTWHAGEIVARHTATTPNPSETAAVQLQDGRVMLNIRNESDSHRRLVSLSADGVSHWSEPAFDEDLFEPVCLGSLVRLTKQPEHAQNRILFVNPDSRNSPQVPNDGGAWPRENLTLRLSYDEGQTWPVSKVLQPDISGYADLAVGHDGTIYCLYEDGGVDGNAFDSAYLTLACFNLEWLTDVRDSVLG